jgi:hypothetical protein
LLKHEKYTTFFITKKYLSIKLREFRKQREEQLPYLNKLIRGGQLASFGGFRSWHLSATVDLKNKI